MSVRFCFLTSVSSSLLQYLGTTLQNNISNFLPLFCLKIIKNQIFPFSEAMQTKVGQLNINFREVTSEMLLYGQSSCLLLYEPFRKITRDVQTTLRKSLALPLPILILPEDASSQISRNFNWIPSEETGIIVDINH